MQEYQSPELQEIGTIEELTEQKMNKVGQTPDSFTAITGGTVVGSLVPAS